MSSNNSNPNDERRKLRDNAFFAESDSNPVNAQPSSRQVFVEAEDTEANPVSRRTPGKSPSKVSKRVQPMGNDLMRQSASDEISSVYGGSRLAEAKTKVEG
jgi:hypothetical protein